jgi:potassium efflux system protein
MHRLVPILLALLVAGQGHAQPTPPVEDAAAAGWIRPDEVPARADALRRQLAAAQPTETAQAALGEIEKDLEQLGPDLDAGIEQATAALARSTPFLELEDLRSQLTAAAAPLDVWEDALAGEAQRVAEVLDDIAQAQRVWSQTRERPETAAAGTLVERRVQTSLEALNDSAATLRHWQVQILAVSNRVAARRSAVDATLARLRAATRSARMNLLVPRHAPLWRSDFRVQLRKELPRVPDQIRAYARGTRAYVERAPRPLVLQALLAVVLMFALRGFSARARERLAREAEPSRATRSLERPYALALLLALLASPGLHPLAPRRFIQLMATVALFPAARIVMHTSERVNVSTFAGLLVLFLLDRMTLALSPLPAVARASFLLAMVTALALAFWFARRAAEAPRLRRIVHLAIGGLGLAILAELGGWANLATLLGRGIIAGAIAALYLYAAVTALEPILIYALTAQPLRRSALFDRNAVVLQRRVQRGLPWVGAILWLYLVLGAVGMRSTAADALRGLLQAGVSVGALSLSVGAVLAFVLTLLGAMLLARIVNSVLEADVYPRTRLPRGIPYALSTLVRYTAYSLGFLLALAAAGVQLGQLTILVGGFGVGIGLGLQDLVKNFAAGLTLLIERRVHVGDALQIPSQEIFGRVLSIGMRATVVRSWNGSEVVVPNADLVSTAVTNWTLSDRLRRIEVPVGVAYGTDPERVIALLLDVAQSNEHMLAQPAPQALFKGFGDSSLDFVLRAWTDEEYERTAALTSELALAVHRGLVEAGISIPFPQRDLHLASVSPAVRAVLPGLAGDAMFGQAAPEVSKGASKTK